MSVCTFLSSFFLLRNEKSSTFTAFHSSFRTKFFLYTHSFLSPLLYIEFKEKRQTSSLLKQSMNGRCLQRSSLQSISHFSSRDFSFTLTFHVVARKRFTKVLKKLQLVWLTHDLRFVVYVCSCVTFLDSYYVLDFKFALQRKCTTFMLLSLLR